MFTPCSFIISSLRLMCLITVSWLDVRFKVSREWGWGGVRFSLLCVCIHCSVQLIDDSCPSPVFVFDTLWRITWLYVHGFIFGISVLLQSSLCVLFLSVPLVNISTMQFWVIQLCSKSWNQVLWYLLLCSYWLWLFHQSDIFVIMYQFWDWVLWWISLILWWRLPWLCRLSMLIHIVCDHRKSSIYLCLL